MASVTSTGVAHPVPRLDAPDKIGRLPLRVVVWLGAGLASGPIVSLAVAWWHGASPGDGWGYPATWLLWLVGLGIGAAGALYQPHGLDLSQWLLLAGLGWWEQHMGPLPRPPSAVLEPADAPRTVADLLALPERLLWVAWSRPGGLTDYSREKRNPIGAPASLGEAQRRHIAALRQRGAIRQTDEGKAGLLAPRAPFQTTLLLRTWPPMVGEGWLGDLLFRLGGDVQIVLQTTRLGPKEARDKLRAQRTIQTQLLAARQHSGAPLDYEDQANLDSPSRLAAALVAGTEALFDVGVALVIRASSNLALDVLRAGLTGHADALGLRWEPAPTGWHPRQRIPYRRTIDSTTLLASSPSLTHEVGTGTGPLWGVTIGERAPVRLDLWDTAAGWPAAHVVFVAQTGAGKTVTFGHLLCEHLTLPDPPRIVILDPVKGDYRRLVRSVGGEIIFLGSGRGGTDINAFDLPAATVLSGTGEETRQNPVLVQTRLVTGLLALMVAEDGQRLRRLERAQIEQAIVSAYASKGISADRPSSWTLPVEAMPVLPDVLTELERSGADDLAVRLRPFCTGTLSGLFNRPTTLRMDAQVTSFDLEGMDEELRPLAIWLVGNFVWKAAKADRRRRILALEEVRTLLEYPESARLVAHLYSLGRAYGLSVWSATQRVGDFTATAEGRQALENAPTICLLRQAPGSVAEAGERFGLPDAEQVWLQGCRSGEGLLLGPRGRTRFQVMPPPAVLSLVSPGAT